MQARIPTQSAIIYGLTTQRMCVVQRILLLLETQYSVTLPNTCLYVCARIFPAIRTTYKV
jgi:hypothetical protein